MIKKMIIGIFAGGICGLFGTGGGMILVPAFVYMLDIEPKRARATSLCCMLVMVITSSIFYYSNNYINLFQDFYYPDGTQPTWKEIDTLQRMFMKWFNKLRLQQIVAFPVETFAMVHDGKDIVYPYKGELIDLNLPPSNSFYLKVITFIKRVIAVRKIKKKYHIFRYYDILYYRLFQKDLYH